MFERLRRLRNHGTTKAAADRHGGAYQHWDVVELGYKANMTDLDAALLRPQLERVEDKRSLRAQIARRYRSRLGDLVADFASPSPGVHGVPWLMACRGLGSHHLFTVHAWLGERDALLAKLGERAVGTAVNYRALHTLTYFAETLGVRRGALPIAEEIGDRTISLPMFPTLTSAEQEHVVLALASAWSELADGRE
jgi:UDP-4-amino-4-deoxy-L-arabinose-oxoglutarate aminotransferase